MFGIIIWFHFSCCLILGPSVGFSPYRSLIGNVLRYTAQRSCFFSISHEGADVHTNQKSIEINGECVLKVLCTRRRPHTPAGTSTLPTPAEIRTKHPTQLSRKRVGIPSCNTLVLHICLMFPSCFRIAKHLCAIQHVT